MSYRIVSGEDGRPEAVQLPPGTEPNIDLDEESIELLDELDKVIPDMPDLPEADVIRDIFEEPFGKSAEEIGDALREAQRLAAYGRDVNVD